MIKTLVIVTQKIIKIGEEKMKKTKRILSLILVIMLTLSSLNVALATVTITQIPLRVKEWEQSHETNIVIFTDSAGRFEVIDIGNSIIEGDILLIDFSNNILSTEDGEKLRSYITVNNGLTWTTGGIGEYSSITLENPTFDIVYSNNNVLDAESKGVIYN